MKIHIVQKGDTLWKIAKKYGVNFEQLKKMNSQLSNPDMIMPGMKIKVPTTGGMVKKEAPIAGTTPGAAIQLGAKKEMPVLEHPFAKEQPKPLPVVEAPVKEMPIVKEAPKAPFTPKMPLPVIPEIDINNYYMMNMAQMNVQQPIVKPAPAPAPAPVPAPMPPKVPEIKEAPVVEAPVETCPQGVEQPMYPVYCVPVSPVMPGPGCYPMAGYPVQPVMPYQPYPSEIMPMTTSMVPPTTGVAPTVAGASYTPPHFDDESSSFMPQMPMMNSTMGMGGQNPMAGTQPIQAPYMQQAIPPTAQMPLEYQTMPSGYPAAPNPGYAEMLGAGMNPGYQMPTPGYPVGGYPGYQPSPYYPGGYGQTPVMASPYGQLPYGYPQMGTVPQAMGAEIESPSMNMPQMGTQTYPMQGQTPVSTGGLGDCGCGVPQNFVPTTPPVYSAPYTAPINVAQPPYMNPYGVGPMGANLYAMPRYDDESNDY